MEEDLFELKPTVEGKTQVSLAKVVVIRHAESIANTQGIYQGRSYDTDLSELGVKQAKALAKRAKGVGVAKIITSPLRRAYQTALEISRICDCPIEISEQITETNHGIWEGKSKSWIAKNYPETYKTWLTKPGSVVFPYGEAFVDTLRRVEEFLRRANLEENTFLVTHDNILRIMVILANGWSLDEIWRYDIEPGALNFFEVNKVAGKNKLKVLKLNDSEHLRGIRADLSKHAL